MVLILEGVALFLLAVWLFFGIALICDEFLCPALDKMCEYYNVPVALGAVTLISFGSSAPELVISTFGAASSQTELSIPAVFTSALIAFLAIPACVVFVAGTMELKIVTLFRDGLAYQTTLIVFLIINSGKTLSGYWAIPLVLLYLVYLFVVNATTFPDVAETPKGESFLQTLSSITNTTVTTPLRHSRTFSNLAAKLAEEDKNPAASGVKSVPSVAEEPQEEQEEESNIIVHYLQLPFNFLFEKTVIGGFNLQFLISMIWLCLLSYAALEIAVDVAKDWGLSDSTAGLTLLAWGGQIPDLLAAIALAKSGEPDAAIAQVIASQVINVSLGLGLPLFGYTAITGLDTQTKDNGAVQMVGFVVIVSIFIYFAGMIVGGEGLEVWKSSKPVEWTTSLGRKHAMAFGVSFVILYAFCILEGEMNKTVVPAHHVHHIHHRLHHRPTPVHVHHVHHPATVVVDVFM